MTHTALRALSLQNYWENPRMRAVRDGEQGRKKLSSPARIEYVLQRKKEKEKRGGHIIKCLLTELGWARRENIWHLVMAHGPQAKYFPVRPSNSVNK